MSINGVYIKLNYIDVYIVSLECVKQIKAYVSVLFAFSHSSYIKHICLSCYLF